MNTLVAAHHSCLIEPVPVAAVGRDDGEHGSGEPAGLAALDQLRTHGPSATRWRFLEIHALQVQGLSTPMIGRRLGLDIKTVRRYLCADSVEQLVAGGVRTSKLDPFKPYLHQRLTAGVRNATALHAEIVEQGYTGSYPILERYLQAVAPQRCGHPAHVVRNRPPPVRQVTAWITGLPGHLDGADEARYDGRSGPAAPRSTPPSDMSPGSPA